MRIKEIMAMTPEDRKEKLEELKRELMHERGVAAMGGSPHSPGRLKYLRRSVARMLTIMHEKGEQ